MKKLLCIVTLFLAIISKATATTTFLNYLPCALTVTVVCYDMGCAIVSETNYNIPAGAQGAPSQVKMVDCVSPPYCTVWTIRYANLACTAVASVSDASCCGFLQSTTFAGCPGTACQSGGTIDVSFGGGFVKIY